MQNFNKMELDNWCSKRLKSLKSLVMHKYPKCRSHIDTDISDFYIHVIERKGSIENLDAYFLTFIFNRYYRFFTNSDQESGFLTNTKKCKIQIVEDLTDLISDTDQDEDLDLHQIQSISDIIVKLPLDYKRLYQLYYQDGLSTRQIGRLLNISHGGIHKQLVKLKNIVKEKL